MLSEKRGRTFKENMDSFLSTRDDEFSDISTLFCARRWYSNKLRWLITMQSHHFHFRKLSCGKNEYCHDENIHLRLEPDQAGKPQEIFSEWTFGSKDIG